MGFHADLMGFSADLMGFRADLMGFRADLIGLSCRPQWPFVPTSLGFRADLSGICVPTSFLLPRGRLDLPR